MEKAIVASKIPKRPRQNTIKAVIFDWGGVLIDDPVPKISYYAAKHLGVPAQALLAVHKNLSADFQVGALSEGEYWKVMCTALDVPTPKQKSLWKDSFRFAYSEKKETFALIDRLRANGYKIGYLSNTEAAAEEFFKEQKYKVFDATIFSCSVGLKKPDKKIYELAAKKLSVKTAEAVFIDDKPEFAEGARKAGMGGIVFENIEQVKADLKKLRVKID